MGTRITVHYASGQELRLELSNGAAEALILTLLLAGSRTVAAQRAEPADPLRAWELELLRFLASHDRQLLGNAVGFDIGRLGWTTDFESQKRRLSGWIDTALGQTESLVGAWFSVERLLPNLGALRLMLSHLTVADLPDDTGLDWPLEPPELAWCPSHQVVMNIAGCPLCQLD